MRSYETVTICISISVCSRACLHDCFRFSVSEGCYFNKQVGQVILILLDPMAGVSPVLLPAKFRYSDHISLIAAYSSEKNKSTSPLAQTWSVPRHHMEMGSKFSTKSQAGPPVANSELFILFACSHLL